MAWWNAIIPTKNQREIKRLREKVTAINDHEQRMRALPDSALQAKTGEFRERFERAFSDLGGDPKRHMTEGTKEELKAERKKVDQALEGILFEAFAVTREASQRALGMRHYDVQLLGGMVLHEGKVAEMRTGEGKTLVATLPVYLNAIAGRGCHVITVNEYLASRDAQWMGQIYNFLGMGVGVITHGLDDHERQQAYHAPITYGTNSEIGFDYLRDNMKLFLKEYVQRGAHFAIVDEVDSILIDEARTPLIISGPAEESTDKYVTINAIIPGLRRERDYTVDEKARQVLLTEAGVHVIEERLKLNNLYDAENIEILHHVNQALRAHTLFRRDVDYMVREGKVQIVDEFTGRVLEGRRWSEGLHQAIEAKEGVKIQNENQTLATITYQNLFRMYQKLSGMTGTAETEAEEFAKIYDLDVVVVPTNKPIARADSDDVVYKSEREKFIAIAEEIKDRSLAGQPNLVGTTSVEKSEVLSKLLNKLGIEHSVLNAKYHAHEAAIVAQAGRKGAVTIATNMAGRGTDILLGGNPEFLARTSLPPDASEADFERALEKLTKQTSQERDEVLAAGGLHIIGCERHESRRIDNQLRGRAGRQGDPGSSRFFLSLDDDLMRIFGGDRMKNLMHRMGMKEGEVIEHRWVNKSIENAQRKVEGHNFDIRKHLLEYDDVMNDQRRAVYKLRRTVIGADKALTKEMVLDLIEESIIAVVQRTCPERSHFDEWNYELLNALLRDQFDLETSFTSEGRDDFSRAQLEEEIYDLVEKTLAKKEEEYSEDALYSVSRVVYLQIIDQLWKEHLREMDQLREGIGLRGYAQKDPKHEYKREGYETFARMMAATGSEVLHKIFRVVITSETEESYQERLRAQAEKRARMLGQQRTRKEAELDESDDSPKKDKTMRKMVARQSTANQRKRERRRRR